MKCKSRLEPIPFTRVEVQDDFWKPRMEINRQKTLPAIYQQLKANEQTRDIPVIVVTAKAQSIDKVLGLHIAKVDDYISNPFSPKELLNSVELVLERAVTAQT